MDCSPLGSPVHGILHVSGLPFPSPGDLLDPGIEPTSPVLAVRFCTSEPPRKSTINATLTVTETVKRHNLDISPCPFYIKGNGITDDTLWG